MKKLNAIVSLLLGSSLVSTGAQAVEIQAGDIKLNIGGYVRADFFYDDSQDLGSTNFAGGLETNPTSEDAHFRAQARQSRFGLSADNGKAKLTLEGDFFGGGGNETVSNSYQFRLRHANIKYGNWTVGQTWSTFMDRDFIAYPTTVDFDGPTGAVFVRQSVLRYSRGNFDFAIENPESTAISEQGGVAPTVTEQLPDLVVRYTSRGDNFSWYGAALAQNFKAESGSASGESETLFGLHVGAAAQLKSIAFSAAVVANGGRYTYNAFNQPSLLAVNGSLEPVDSLGVVLAASVPVAKGTVGLVLGSVQFDDQYQTALGLQSPEQFNSAHLNYRFDTSDQVSHGLEVSYVDREDFDGDKGDNTRLQYGVSLSF